jgi:phytoene synthase
VSDVASVDVEACRSVLHQRARSFRWATLFLDPGRRDDVAILYAFCRAVDDAADDGRDAERAAMDLDVLERGLVGGDAPLARAVRAVASRRGLPIDAARDLIRGARRDLGPVRIETDDDLLEYGYLVAGTVGRMACALLGAVHPSAEPHAIHLGIAMQITNVCRDVAEDAAAGRVYLPEARLRRAGTSQEEILRGTASREAVAAVVRDLLELADAYYRSGDDGLAYLPPRPRLAATIASRLYRAIGLRLLASGADPLAGRAVVPPWSKLAWGASAVVAWLFGCLRRGAWSPTSPAA